MFGTVDAPRHKSYIEYSARTMLGTLYYKSIVGISSMQEMTRAFNDDVVCENLYNFMGGKRKEHPIIIAADGLYVTQKVLQICKDYRWDYIIRYKEGSASSIAKEYQALPEKETVGTDIGG